MAKKKNSDNGIANGIAKIKKRVEALVKDRPSHKEVLEFFADVVAEQYTILSKVKTSPIEIDKEDFKTKIVEGFPLVDKKPLLWIFLQPQGCLRNCVKS